MGDEPPSVPVNKGVQVCRFIVPGTAIGKPRMTRSDVWRKRPAVLRYRAFCDLVRSHAPTLPADVFGIFIVAYMPMPPSWSNRKTDLHWATINRQRPDGDNILKAVMDALFEEDSGIGVTVCTKIWCKQEEAQLHINLFHH